MRLVEYRPLLLILIATAIFAVGLLPQLPPWWLVMVLTAIALLLIYSRYWPLALLILAAMYGIGYGKCLLANQLPTDLDNQWFYIIGVVSGLPHGDPLKQRFQLQIEYLHPLNHQKMSQPIKGDANNRIDGLVRLSWYHSRSGKRAHVEVGQRWQLHVKLRRPRSFANPAGFDYQGYLMSQGVVATGYVKSSDFNKLLEDSPRSAHPTYMATHIDSGRDYFKRRFINWARRQQTLGLLLALAIGERSLISADQWALLRNTGTIHLMAISGLHISLAAIIGFCLGLFCSRLWQLAFPMTVVSYYFPPLFSMITALLYGLLAGMNLPTQRALIMVLVVHCATISCRNISPWLLLAIALVVIALHDPLAIYNPGFWLSFLAVAVLLYSFIGRLTVVEANIPAPAPSDYPSNSLSNYLPNCLFSAWLRLQRLRLIVGQYLKTLLWSQWVLTLGLLIPSLFWLQGTSLSAPLANSIAVPCVSLAIVPLLLLTMMMSPLQPAWAADIYRLTERILAGLLDVLQWIDRVLPNFVSLPVGQLPWITLILAGIAVVWLLSPRGIPQRYLSVLLLLPLVFPSRETPHLSVTFLDVGQGTAVIIETPNHVLVYDTGPGFSRRFNAGAHIIAPYLRYRGRATIDHLIVSHADEDHAGGLIGLIDNMAVGSISSGEPLPTERPIIPCRRGQAWQWDGVRFAILWPLAAVDADNPRSENAESGNNASCVLLITYQGRTILLPGDIEAAVERRLLATTLLPGKIDILLAPHHGSRSSSSSAWVKQLSPRWAVITAGYNSRYGHPHQRVVDRYLQQRATVLNTATAGALQFTLDSEDNWQVTGWRQSYRRYWLTPLQ